MPLGSACLANSVVYLFPGVFVALAFALLLLLSMQGRPA